MLLPQKMKLESERVLNEKSFKLIVKDKRFITLQEKTEKFWKEYNKLKHFGLMITKAMFENVLSLAHNLQLITYKLKQII